MIMEWNRQAAGRADRWQALLWVIRVNLPLGNRFPSSNRLWSVDALIDKTGAGKVVISLVSRPFRPFFGCASAVRKIPASAYHALQPAPVMWGEVESDKTLEMEGKGN